MEKPAGRTRVLLLDELDDGRAVSISRCLQLAGGYEVHCLSSTADHVLRRSRHCHVQHVAWDSPAAMLGAVAAYVEREPIDLIIAIHEPMIEMAGQVAEQMERLAPLAAQPDPVLCDRVDNKWSFHQMMEAAGVRVPRATVAGDDRAALLVELDGWGSPLMLKPTLLSGGRGIRSFEQADDLLEALDDPVPGTPDELLIQEFIPGQDVSCNLLCDKGEIVAYTMHRSVLLQAGAFTSAALGLEFIRDESVMAMAASFAEVSRWSGVANLNIRIDSRTGELFLIEVNPRYWQTLLGSAAMGVNFPDLHCRLALGERPTAPMYRTGFYLDSHSLLMSPRNVVALLRHDPGFVRYARLRIMLADPRVEATMAYDTAKRQVVKAISHVRRLVRRIVAGRGRSSQPR